MKKTKIVAVMIICLLAFRGIQPVEAQDSFRAWEFQVFAGFNMGGTTPVPLPAEIRSLNSWNPGLGGALAFRTTRWVTPAWGVTSGLAIDIKGMKVSADVKYWYTSLMVGEGDNTGHFAGTFSGENHTTARNGYLVIPLMAAWRPADRWTFRLGGYVASLQDARFEGTASDGYIRNGGPTGDRINIDRASYDFSDELRKTDAGLMASADWTFTRRLAVTGQFSYGLVPVFPSGFEGVSYSMYNVYLMLGLAYKL